MLEVCGDLTDEQVIASNAKLTKLTEILNGRDVDKHRDTIKAQMKKINEEIDKIPVRINETQLGMPDIEGIEKDKLPKDIAVLQKDLQAKQQELARVQSGGEIAEKKKQLAEVEAEILRKQNEANVANNAEVAKKQAELEKATDKGLNISTRIKELRADIEANARTIQTAKQRRYSSGQGGKRKTLNIHDRARRHLPCVWSSDTRRAVGRSKTESRRAVQPRES